MGVLLKKSRIEEQELLEKELGELLLMTLNLEYELESVLELREK